MTEKQIALSNLTRKQKIARRRALARRDGDALANAGVVLEGVRVGEWRRPGVLSNPIPIPIEVKHV